MKKDALIERLKLFDDHKQVINQARRVQAQLSDGLDDFDIAELVVHAEGLYSLCKEMAKELKKTPAIRPG